MKPLTFLITIVCFGLIAGCAASVPPTELINARQAYEQAINGPAAQLAPAELHKAYAALALAEKSFKEDPKSFRTRDLAYIADRKAKMAEALAVTVAQKAALAKANNEYAATQAEIVKNTKEDLVAAERTNALKSDELAASKRSGALTAEQLVAERKARADADKRTADAQAALINLAAVKEEARGLVITLSGSVLFASGKSTLLPSAQNRLNQVAEALMAMEERALVVEGHTDSQGTNDYNQELSQKRADAVRSYIISRGYPGDLIKAVGIGEVRPVAENNNAEGRANNRRVEIIIDRSNLMGVNK